MALYKPEKHKIADVLNWYLQMNISSFDITQKKVHGKGFYHGDSMEEGLEKLDNFLTELKGEDNSNDYVLQLNTTKSKTKTSDIMYCLTFDFAGEFKHNVSGVPVQYNNGLSHNDIKAIAEEIRRQDVGQIEDEIEDLEPEQPSLLAGIMNNPEVQQAIAATIVNLPALIGGIFGKKAPIATSLSGVCDDKNLDEVIQILFSKGVNITHLRKLADMPQDKITMLISML
jgi:galactitol-specific phosphotransferase system IIB component